MFKFQARKKAIAQRIREERFKKLIKQYMEAAEVRQMDEYIQHGTTTTLTHCHNVAWLCFLVNEYLHLNVIEKSGHIPGVAGMDAVLERILDICQK